MARTSSVSSRQGLLYGLAAYGLWGLAVPLYFKAVVWVSPVELLAERILWTAVVLVGLLTLTRRWKELQQVARSPRTLALLAAGGVLIGINWLVYIYSVATDRMVQAGLGYFMLPLISMLFGMLFLGERLRTRQWLAVALAGLGVVNLAMRAERLPWIALALAGSFGLYGLLRKTAPVEGLIGLTVEVLFLAPFALAWLGYRAHTTGTAWAHASWGPDLVIVLSGAVTAIPLLCFGRAARLLPLTTLGFIQYLSPSLQCLLAVWLFGEPFTSVQLATFICIWIALALFSLDSIVARRAGLAQEAFPPTSGSLSPEPAAATAGSSSPLAPG